MNSKRTPALAAILAVSLAAGTSPLAAESGGHPPPAPEGEAENLVENLLSTLRGLLEAIPRYEMPEMNENGDIIIRRVRPEPDAGDPDALVRTTET